MEYGLYPIGTTTLDDVEMQVYRPPSPRSGNGDNHIYKKMIRVVEKVVNKIGLQKSFNISFSASHDKTNSTEVSEVSELSEKEEDVKKSLEKSLITTLAIRTLKTNIYKSTWNALQKHFNSDSEKIHQFIEKEASLYAGWPYL